MAKSLSFGKGKGNIAHNNRDYETPNVDHDRVKDNITFVKQDITEAYRELFQGAIEEYNAHQKRSDRKKSLEGYIDEIKRNQANKNGEKLFYEQVIGIGDMFDSGVLTNPAEAEKCKQILCEYMEEWKERNPNLHVFNAVLHMDEATPHVHVDYIPIGQGYKQGLQSRNSLTKAFENMGIDSAKSKEDNATIKWQQRERERIIEIAREHGVEIGVIGIKREDYTVAEYKALVSNRMHEVRAMDRVEPKRINLPFGLALETNRAEVDKALDRQYKTKELSKEYKQATKEIHQTTQHVKEGLSDLRDERLQVHELKHEYEEKLQTLEAKEHELDARIREQKELNHVLDQTRYQLGTVETQLRLANEGKERMREEIAYYKGRYSESLEYVIELKKDAEKGAQELVDVKKAYEAKIDSMAQNICNMGSAFKYLSNRLRGEDRDIAKGGAEYAKHWLKKHDLGQYASRIMSTLSKGMNQRIEQVRDEREHDRGR